MDFWKAGRPQIPKLNLQPVREKLTNVIWKEEPIPEGLNLFKLNEHLIGKKKVRFESVSYYVDEFVEIYVPLQVDKIYSVCSLIKKLKHLGNEEELSLKYNDAKEVIKIEKLESHICDEDFDDFELQIQPAKQKLKDAADYLLKTNGHKIAGSTSSSQPTECQSIIEELPPVRSPKARDLLSFLSDDADHPGFEESSFSGQQTQIVEQLPEIKQLEDDEMTSINFTSNENCEESLQNLNNELVELQGLMSEFHQFVHLQGEVVDGIADNVDVAQENVTQGNIQLKKANILKAAMFPILGAVIGGVVGGPIGLVAGMKVGSVTGGLAMAGVTGTVVGYQGGKMLKKRQQEQIELNTLNEEDDR